MEGVEFIHLAQDRHRCQALVNMVMNPEVWQKMENFLTESIIYIINGRK
jgi:hypothetical protein